MGSARASRAIRAPPRNTSSWAVSTTARADPLALTSSWPAGFFLRLQGAAPQNRLSADEQADVALCPESLAVVPDRPCSGAPGFGTADIGVWLQVGQLRFDVVGENITDTQGAWRSAALGTGGTAVRARVAFVF